MRKSRIGAFMAALALLAVACAGEAEDPDTGAEDASDNGTDEASDTDGDDESQDDASGADTDDDGGERRVLRQATFGADVGTMDPHQAVPGPDRQVVLPMFDGLVRYVPGDALAGFEPDLATEVPSAPEPEEDGTQVWEFELREGVMCHPGPETDSYELTVDDVVKSYQRSMNSEISAFAGDYGNVTSIEAVDDRTVAFTLNQPSSEELFLPLVANISGGYVVCMEAVEAMGDADFANHPVGTGPFQFSSYSPSDRVELTAFDEYWRGEPRLEGVEILFMADDSSRELALRSGEVDFISGINEGEWAERMDEEDGITAFAIPVGGLQFFELNTSMEPFDDINVRRAVMYAHNRGNHVALGGQIGGESYFTPAFSASNLPDGPADLTEEEVRDAGLDWIVDQDLDRARELLAEAGYPDGFSFDVVSSESEAYVNNYQVLQANLAEVGIEMNVDVVDHPTMHSVIREGSNAIVQYTAPRPTVDLLLFQFLHGDSIVVEGETPITNFAYYDGVDDLIDEAKNEVDAERQEQLWIEANLQAMEDAVIMPNYHHRYAWAHADDFDQGHEPIAWMHSAASTINENTGFHN